MKHKPDQNNIEKANLNEGAIVLAELVVVFDLDGHALVAVQSRQLDVRRILHVEVAEEVRRPDA